MPPCVIVGDRLGKGTTWCAGNAAASAANPREGEETRASPSETPARRCDRKGAHLRDSYEFRASSRSVVIVASS